VIKAKRINKAAAKAENGRGEAQGKVHRAARLAALLRVKLGVRTQRGEWWLPGSVTA
jgi:hypothetical protein